MHRNSTRGDLNNKTIVSVPWAIDCLPPSALSSRFTQTRYSAISCFREPDMPWKRKRCWTAGALCRLDSSFTPEYDSEQDLGSPEALIPRGEEASEDDKPFQPRFLLQEIFHAHSPYEGVFRNQPRLQVNLLCRSDWLCLRGIAETECAILPIRELAANPRCSACEQTSSGRRPSARRSLPASVLLDEFGWRRGDSPCSGRTDSVCDSEPDLWKLHLDVDGEFHR